MEKNKPSIFDSPFSDETKKLRFNSLLATGVCLFIGLTQELPSKFSLLGISFSTNQQSLIGWFIFSISIYLFLHFISMASVEFAQWLQPLYMKKLTKDKLLKHPAFDETDFFDFPVVQYDSQNRSDIATEAKEESYHYTEKRLKYLFSFVYIKLVIEVAVPLIVGVWGLILFGIMLIKIF